MSHPLKCPNCNNEFRYIKYEGVRFEHTEIQKGFGINIPLFYCKKCGQQESILPEKPFRDFEAQILPEIQEFEFIDLPLSCVFPEIDSDKKFECYSSLELDYDSRDYYLIPGLFRDWDSGYLTPVFFDKDLLLHYNNHTDYSVKLTSFSSGNIYDQKGEAMFRWGFGINRNGKIFKWLGDLEEDFQNESMKPHLLRFRASNVPSDHDVISKFYFSQIPFSPSDAFQDSDNETLLFRLTNEFHTAVKTKFHAEITQIDIEKLTEYYKPPILDEREQVFNAYLSLNKYLVENLDKISLKKILLNHGLVNDDFKKNGNEIGSLKLFEKLIDKVFQITDASKIISPLFVLYDLRNLHGHINEGSFETKYNTCKERLCLNTSVKDLEVWESLVKQLINFYQTINSKLIEAI